MGNFIKKTLISTLLLSSLTIAGEYNGFGGVWIGSTSFTDSDENGLNVGSFFFAKTPLLNNHLHFGYAVSATTEVAVEYDSDLTSESLIVGVGQLVPIEVNAAYAGNIGKFSYWIGGGINLSIASVDITGDYYDYSSNVYCQAQADAQTDTTYGVQFFIGGEYIFGSIGFIGGEWGIFGQYKYQYISEVKAKLEGKATCYDAFGNESTGNISDEVKLDLSNNSYVVGLTYHF